jgi:DNA-binding response OmpR family regulator
LSLNLAGETILVSDDDPSVLASAYFTLIQHGYHVIVASSGSEVLRLFGMWPGLRVSLIVLDLAISDMRGVELAKHINTLRPGVPVIFSSHNKKRSLPPTVAQDAPYIAKPFTWAQLTETVRKLLDRPPSEVQTA